ncbi:MAG: flagellar biosynthesis protein FlhB [Candidatus Zixiibacteriota bacterium]
MADDSIQEKTESATPHRREEARKKGQVARSAEMNSFAVLFLGTLFLLFAAPSMGRDLAGLMREFLGQVGSAPSATAEYVSILTRLGIRVLILLAPLFLMVMAVAVMVNGAQVGFRFAPEALQPKFDRFNIPQGFKRVFSRRSLVELIRDVIKLTIIGTVAWFAVRAEMDGFISLSESDTAAILTFTAWTIFRVGIKIIIALLALSLADFAFQKWDFERSIRMTRHEIKEEFRQQEGSPQMRSRIRQVQRELARMRMAREVPKADVVITNPTTLACALKYDPETMGAPTLVAKGARLLAEKIKEIAREANVPIVENKPLARALYASVEVGSPIPADLYKAAAEVLAYVYRLRGQVAAAAEQGGAS